MNTKQLSRIANALEQIADNQGQMLELIQKSADKGAQDLNTHGEMFEQMKGVFEPLLAAAARKADAEPEQPAPGATLSAPLKAIERNGVRILVSDTPREIEVNAQ